jgi:hypothetical protein
LKISQTPPFRGLFRFEIKMPSVSYSSMVLLTITGYTSRVRGPCGRAVPGSSVRRERRSRRADQAQRGADPLVGHSPRIPQHQPSSALVRPKRPGRPGLPRGLQPLAYTALCSGKLSRPGLGRKRRLIVLAKI